VTVTIPLPPDGDTHPHYSVNSCPTRTMRVWFNGRTSASQAPNAGSIPITHSILPYQPSHSPSQADIMPTPVPSSSPLSGAPRQHHQFVSTNTVPRKIFTNAPPHGRLIPTDFGWLVVVLVESNCYYRPQGGHSSFRVFEWSVEHVFITEMSQIVSLLLIILGQ
jgi:hypothetical protein